jgi:hypothetical protein
LSKIFQGSLNKETALLNFQVILSSFAIHFNISVIGFIAATVNIHLRVQSPLNLANSFSVDDIRLALSSKNIFTLSDFLSLLGKELNSSFKEINSPLVN